MLDWSLRGFLPLDVTFISLAHLNLPSQVAAESGGADNNAEERNYNLHKGNPLFISYNE